MLESGWKRRDHSNIMFFWFVSKRNPQKEKYALARYEELKQDQEKMVRKIADFIGYSLSEQQIQAKHVVAKFDPFQSSSLGHN